MFVLSVKGSYKGEKGFYYISKDMTLSNNLNDAISFDTIAKAITWTQENYVSLLQLLLNTYIHVFSDTFAIRKINFKTIKNINNDILKEEVYAGNDEDDENSDTDNIGDSIVDGESVEDAEETSSSDIL